MNANERFAILLDDGEFSVVEKRAAGVPNRGELRHLGSMRWNEVARILTFLRQGYFDLLCAEIVRADESRIEINEEMIGWEEFMRDAQVALPGFRANWREVAGNPAYGTVNQILFQR